MKQPALQSKTEVEVNATSQRIFRDIALKVESLQGTKLETSKEVNLEQLIKGMSKVLNRLGLLRINVGDLQESKDQDQRVIYRSEAAEIEAIPTADVTVSLDRNLLEGSIRINPAEGVETEIESVFIEFGHEDKVEAIYIVFQTDDENEKEKNVLRVSRNVFRLKVKYLSIGKIVSHGHLANLDFRAFNSSGFHHDPQERSPQELKRASSVLEGAVGNLTFEEILLRIGNEMILGMDNPHINKIIGKE